MSRNYLFAAFLSLSTSVGGVALAQDDPAKEVFNMRCAICHGEVGDGLGMVGELFAQRPKDLRLLSKENGGDFPMERVVQSIDGRTKVSAHGTQMPIWGEYLMVEALEDRGINPKDARMVVDARVIALARYIEGLQAK